MKWGEIKAISLQKMFATDGLVNSENINTFKDDEDCKLYLNSMQGVANEALQRIKSYAGVNPEKITSSTTDASELLDTNEELLPDCVCVLIPLYIASQLYKNDDVALATQYRNEFEIGIQELGYNIDGNQSEVEVIF